MDTSVQSLHRLPLMQFDGIRPGTECKIGVDESKNKDGTVNIKLYEPWIADTPLPAVHINQRRPIRNRLNGKIQNTNIGRVNTSNKNIKDTFSVCSNFIKEIFRHRNSHRNVRKLKQQRKPYNRNEKIRVLYSSNSWKLKNRRTKQKLNLIDDIYSLNLNTCINTNPGTKVRQTAQCYNAPRDTTEKDIQCNGLCYSPSFRYDMHTQYKVIDFPNYDNTDTELEAININKEIERIDNQCQTKNKTCEKKNRKINVNMSCFPKALGGGGDGFTVNGEFLASTTKHQQCPKIDKPNIQFKAKNAESSHLKDSFDPLTVHKNAFNLAKVTLKFLIFGLALIVWSPCIITIYFYWCLTYPLKPRHAPTCAMRRRRSTSKIRMNIDNSNRLIDNSNQTCDNHPWSLILRGINWAANSITVSMKALRLQRNLDNKYSKYSCHSSKLKSKSNKGFIMRSHPKKKYTLYYSRKKGWVLKSAKMRSKYDNCNQSNIKDKRRASQKSKYVMFNDRNIAINNNWKQCDQKTETNQGKCMAFADDSQTLRKDNISVPKYCRHRHQHLCSDTSGLPVNFKILNPKYDNNINPTPKLIVKCNSKYIRKKLPLKLPEPQCKTRSFTANGKAETNCTFKDKIFEYCIKTKRNIWDVIKEVEDEVWGSDERSCEMYLQTYKKRKKPWYREYKKFYENLCHFFLLIISACIWCPLLAFCYLNYRIIHKCLK